MRGAIPLCLLLQASSVLGGAGQPRGNHTWCADSGACYSVHLGQVPFDEAQGECAGRGGALSAASGQAEVRAVLALLSAAAAQPGSWLFWLGLERPEQQCTQKDRPLRGFAWLGAARRAPHDEPEELDKWVKEPKRSCTTRGCAGLQVTAGRQGLEHWGWRERPCRSNRSQGYVCKYQYSGTCPAPRPQGARRLLYELPYQLHSGALDFSPPGTRLLVGCPEPRGDVRLRCELGQGGYKWAGAEEQLCPCPSGHRSPSTGACVEPGACGPGPDKKACVRPGPVGGSATAAPGSTLPAEGAVRRGLPGSASPQPSAAGGVKSSASSTHVFLLVATAVLTVGIMVGAVLLLFRLCFASPPAASRPGKEPAPGAAADSDPEASLTESSSEESLEARPPEPGGDAAESERSPEQGAPPGN